MSNRCDADIRAWGALVEGSAATSGVGGGRA